MKGLLRGLWEWMLRIKFFLSPLKRIPNHLTEEEAAALQSMSNSERAYVMANTTRLRAWLIGYTCRHATRKERKSINTRLNRQMRRRK